LPFKPTPYLSIPQDQPPKTQQSHKRWQKQKLPPPKALSQVLGKICQSYDPPKNGGAKKTTRWQKNTPGQRSELAAPNSLEILPAPPKKIGLAWRKPSRQ
jgi:hypothetical protein